MLRVRLVSGSGDGSFSVDENDGSIRVCAFVDSGTLAPGVSVDLQLSTIAGTATGSSISRCYVLVKLMTIIIYADPTADLDYEEMSDTSITFNNLATIGSMMCVNIDIFEDLLCEGDETFEVQLTENEPGVEFYNGDTILTQVVTIIDNDGKSLYYG